MDILCVWMVVLYEAYHDARSLEHKALPLYFDGDEAVQLHHI